MENGGSPAVGDGQLEEKSLQVELGIPQPDVTLAADRAAVADHAIDLHAALTPAGSDTPAQTQRQPVIGKRGRVQAIAMPERGGISGGVLVGIRSRLIPEPAGIAIDAIGPFGLQKAASRERHPAPLGGGRVECRPGASRTPRPNRTSARAGISQGKRDQSRAPAHATDRSHPHGSTSAALLKTFKNT